MRPEFTTAAKPPVLASSGKPAMTPNEELAANVSRFEILVAQHSDYLRRIELLLDEIEDGCEASSRD
jgi:hypothetical protein